VGLAHDMNGTRERIGIRYIVVAVAAAQTAGFAGWTGSPIIVGALIDELGMTAAAAGVMVTAELAALAVATWLSAGLLARRSRKVIGLTGAGVALAGHALSVLAPGFTALLAARLVAGLGEGVALAAGNAVAAGSRHPHQVFARVTAVVVLGIALQLFALPYVTTPFGPAGGYAALAALTLIVSPAFIWLAPPPERSNVYDDHRLPHPALGLLGVVSIALIAIGQGAVWTFTERIAAAAGISAEGAGRVLGGGTLLGIAGASLAIWLGTRQGRTAPITLGTCVGIAAILILVNVPTTGAFTGAAVVWIFVYWFSQPYFFGALAALDNRGRWAASGGGTQIAGTAIGPAVGGLLVSTASYTALGGLAAVIGLLGLAAIFPVVRFADRHASAAVPPSAP